MKSSRIAVAALVAFCVNACSSPNTISSGSGTIPQSNSAATVSQASGIDTSMDSPHHDANRRLYWRPGRLMLQKGAKQSAKLFYEGQRPLRIADDCTGRVAFDQVGFARIKKYRINIYEVLALRPGPYHCAVFAKTAGEPALRAILHIDVSA
jgi:hypothetical protein